MNPARKAKARALNRRWRLNPSHPRLRTSARVTAGREAEHQPALAPVDSLLTARMFGGNFAGGPDRVVTTDDPAAAAVARQVLGGTGS